MPIYEYECEKCGSTFETMQSISAKPLKTCKGLGCNNKDNGKVRRLISATGFILKGEGWYSSDYPSEDRKRGWEAESKAAGGTDKGDKTPGDKTPADKTSDDKTPAPSTAAAPATDKAATAKPAPKKPAQKNPYSGGKRSRTKTSK